MNNIYRVIWNASTNVWQAVSEIGRSGGKTQSVRDGSGASGQGALRSFAATAVMMACAMAHAGPQAPTLPDQGSGVLTNATWVKSDADTKMTITQSAPRAVLNWASFNVGAGNTVSFVQPDSSAIALNRVIGVSSVISRSMIDGTITANGQIFLINPAGITFSKGAQVDVGGIVASTRDLKMTDQEFINSTDSSFTFVKADGTFVDPSIINYGQINAKTTDGAPGYVVMIGAKIINAVHADDADKLGGKITGKNVVLTSGDEVLLSLADGMPAITVSKDTKDALIENHGWITAANGQVLLTTGAVDQLLKAAINNTGVIEAESISIIGTAGTTITLDAAKTADNTSGILKSQLKATAAGTESTPSISLVAGNMTLGKDSELVASDAAASIKLNAKVDLSNAGSIITGEEGATGTVTMTALGEIKNTATGLVKSGTITLDGTTIKLEADATDPDAILKSQLIAATGPVNLKAFGAISNDGLIQSAVASTADVPSISISGDSVTLGATSQLLATAADAAIKVTAAKGELSNAGKIITDTFGESGTVELTATEGSVKGDATSSVRSGTITVNAGKDIEFKGTAADARSELVTSQGGVTLNIAETSVTGLISNGGLIETPQTFADGASPILFNGAKAITLGAFSELKAQNTGAVIQLTASEGDLSIGGKILTGNVGDSGSVDLTATKGSVKGDATSSVKSGTITINAGTNIELKGTAADARSELVASQGPVTLAITDATSTGLISNSGLIETPASFSGVSPILFNGAKAITLGAFSELKAQNTGAVIDLSASQGDISNAGKITTGADGTSGAVNMTALAGTITNSATAVVKSDTITLNTYKLDTTDQTAPPVITSFAITNDGKLEAGQSISLTGKSITLGSTSDLKTNATGSTITLIADAGDTTKFGDIKNAGSIITGEDGSSGFVQMTAGTPGVSPVLGSIYNEASGVVKSGSIMMSAVGDINLKVSLLDQSEPRSQLIASTGSVTLTASEKITNNGYIESSANSGSTIVFSGAKELEFIRTSELKVKAADAILDLTASARDIKNNGLIVIDNGLSGQVRMNARNGDIVIGSNASVQAGGIDLDAKNVTVEGRTFPNPQNNQETVTLRGELIASQNAVNLTAAPDKGTVTINGLVQSKAAEGGAINVMGGNILLNDLSILDASGPKAGAVTTHAGFKLDAKEGAQVKTLSSDDPTKLGTWTASAANVHVRSVVVKEEADPNDNTKTITTVGPTGADTEASTAGTANTPGVLVTRVNLLNTDQTVLAKDLVGDFSMIQKAAKANGTDTTELKVTKEGWNIVVDEVMNKPAAFIVTADGPLKGQSQPQDVTLTLKSERDIRINNEIKAGSGTGRLNVVLSADADVNLGTGAQVITNGGNFYVGKVTPVTPSYYGYPNNPADKVETQGHDFVMQSGSKVDVAGGAFAVDVKNDILLGDQSTIAKSELRSLVNNMKQGPQMGTSWGYDLYLNIYKPASAINLHAGNDITVGGTVNANNAEVKATAGRDILATGDGKINLSDNGYVGYKAFATLDAGRNIGSEAAPLVVNAGASISYLDVTNRGGSTFIRSDAGSFDNITLTTTTTTNGLQSIKMGDGYQVVATATPAAGEDAPALLTIATGGVSIDKSARNPGNPYAPINIDAPSSTLTINAPNMLLDRGAIKAVGVDATLSSDPSVKIPQGSKVTLTAFAEDGVTYGFIRSATGAGVNKTAPDIDVPGGTVNINAKNIGTESANSQAALNFGQSLEISTTALNVNNYGGSTWISNSTFNTLAFKMEDAAGTSGGRHHILSSDGDFFNVESTTDKKLVVYTIDRVALATSTSASDPTGRMSGIFTNSDPDAPKNVTLASSNGNKARDLIFMNDAVDVGSATLSLVAQSGKSLLGYSDKLVQDDTKVFADVVGAHQKTYEAGDKTKPHLTAGNLILTIDNATPGTSTMGGNGYDLKVAKGSPEATFNTLTINNQSGNVALHELDANHFKNIAINDQTANTVHTVAIQLNPNANGSVERINYSDDGTVLKFGNTVDTPDAVAVSGFNRNVSLNFDRDYSSYTTPGKNLQINGFGKVDGKVTSGDFTVAANTIALNGDITTTHRNDSTTADRGNVKLSAYEYKVLSDTKIDTNATAQGADNTSPGNIDLLSKYDPYRNNGYAAPISGNGKSLTLNAASSDATVGGGNITANIVAAGVTNNAMKDLAFTTNAVEGDAQHGQVNISGNQFLIGGNFKASGAVTMSGDANEAMRPYGGGGAKDFKIATNLAGGDSGSITFDGTSFTLNKGYGTATFDTSSSTGKAGDITLWDSVAGDKHTSTVNVGRLVANALGQDDTKNGNIAVQNVDTSGRSDWNSYKVKSNYSDASQTYTADKVILGGNMTTKSGAVNVLAKTEVEIAKDVKIQTYNGNTDETSPVVTSKTGAAGNVTLGDLGATLTVDGKSLEIDASAGRMATIGYVVSGQNTFPLFFIPQHGSITINDSTASTAKVFNKLTLIGGTVGGDVANTAGDTLTMNYSTTGQMTLGILNQPKVTWSGVKANSLLLLGQNSTDYTFDDADIGTLAADATGKLKVTATNDVTIAPLSYVGTFGASPKGIETGADIQVTAASLTVEKNAKVYTNYGKVDLSSSSTAADKGIVLKEGSQVRGLAGTTLTTSGGDLEIGQGASITDYSSSVSLTAKGDIKAADYSYVGAMLNVSLTTAGGAIVLGTGAQVSSYSVGFNDSGPGNVSLTAGKNIELGEDSAVYSYSGSAALKSDKDITLANGSSVTAYYVGDVTLTAGTTGSITGGSTALSSYAGNVQLSAGKDINLGDSSRVSGLTGAILTATTGDITLGQYASITSTRNETTLDASAGKIKTGDFSSVTSTDGAVTLMAGKDIEVGAMSLVGLTTDAVTMTATGDIKLGDYTTVQGAKAVTITATKNTDVDPVKNGDVVLGTGVTVQSSTSGTTANDVTITADGSIKVGVNSSLSSNIGKVALTAGADIEVGVPATVPMLFSLPFTSLISDSDAVTLTAKGDIKLNDFSTLQGYKGVSLTATKNTDTSKNGDIVMGSGVMLGATASAGQITSDVTVKADGAITVGADSVVSSSIGKVDMNAGADITLGAATQLSAYGAVKVESTNGGITLIKTEVPVDPEVPQPHTQINSGAAAVTLTAKGDVNLEDNSIVKGFKGVVITATKNDTNSKKGDVVIGANVSVGESFYYGEDNDVKITADGAVNVGAGSTIASSYNSVQITAGAGIDLGASGRIVASKTLDLTATTGAIVLGESSYVGAYGAVTIKADQDISLGQSSYVGSNASTSLTSDKGNIEMAKGSWVQGYSGDATISAKAINLGEDAQVSSYSGKVSLTATDTSITTGKNSLVKSDFGSVTLLAQTDITLGESSAVHASTDVSLTATTGSITTGAMNLPNTAALESTTGKVTLLADKDITLGEGSKAQAYTDVSLTATTGAVALGDSSAVGGYGTATIKADKDISLGQGSFVGGYLGSSLTSDKGNIEMAMGSSAQAFSGDVTLSAKAINMGEDAQVSSYSGKVSLTATDTSITTGKNSLVNSYYGSATLLAKTDITLGESSAVRAYTDVSLTATQGAVSTLGNNNLYSSFGKIAVNAGTDITLGEANDLTSATGLDLITPQGKIQVGVGTRLASVGPIKVEVTGEGSIDFAPTTTLQSYSSSSANKISTGTGDITFAANAYNSGGNTGEWLTISAGSSKTKGDATGGNVTFTGTISSGLGRALIYTGSADEAEKTAEGATNGYNTHYNLGAYVYNTDLTDPKFAALPAGQLGVAFRQAAGNLTLAAVGTNVYDGKVWVSTVADATKESKATISVSGLRSWEAAAATGILNTSSLEAIKDEVAKQNTLGAVYDHLVTNKFLPDSLVSDQAGTVLTNAGTYTAKFVNNSIGGNGVAINPVGYGIVASDFTITPKDATVTMLDVTKVYDGNTNAKLTAANFQVSGLVGDQQATVTKTTGSFNSKNVLQATTVTTTLAAADVTDAVANQGTGFMTSNYSFKLVDGVGTITPRPLIATATAEDKVFDTKVGASAKIFIVQPTPAQLSDFGVVGNDKVTLKFGDAAFIDSRVGNKKTVTLSGVETDGPDAANYGVYFEGKFPSPEVTTEASIRPVNLPPIVVAPSAPTPAPVVPPNLSNGPVSSIGTMAVVNVDSGKSAGGMTEVTLEMLATDKAVQPNQVYVVDGGIQTNKADK